MGDELMARNLQDVDNLKTMWKLHYELKAKKALEFISETIGDRSLVTSGDLDNFHNQLKDGVYLGKLVNALKPDTTIPETYFAPTREKELIELTIIGMGQLGVTGLFQKDDLVEMKNLTKWLKAICALQGNEN
eukprot:GAHX01001909.1.p1 GENE.GAHX01001909.1~~GAHX01001909.1.p1  ORF type:complete len:149 (+),score=25.49 GAHX01001909.1:51-449(+)